MLRGPEDLEEYRDEIRRTIFRKITERAADASRKRVEHLTMTDKVALAICAGCDFELSATGLTITEPFFINAGADGRLVVYRLHAKKQGTP